MGFGGSADIFQAQMMDLMASLEYVRAYIDDLLIITRGTLDDHVKKIEIECILFYSTLFYSILFYVFYLECILFQKREKERERILSTDSHMRGDRHKSISFFYYLILTTILWGVADQFPQLQYLERSTYS